MGSANEYLLQNKELNHISKGFLWGLWNLLPIAGQIIVTIKILNRIFRSTSSKVLMFIALIIPVVNIGAAIYLLVLTFERIGGKFLIGVLILPVVLGIFAAKGVPIYTGFVERARVIEGTGCMGTIIISQKLEREKTGEYYTISLGETGTDFAAFEAKGVNITDKKFFTYETAMVGAKPDIGFIVRATTTDTFGFGAAGGWIQYMKTPKSRAEVWACDGKVISPDMLPIIRR